MKAYVIVGKGATVGECSVNTETKRCSPSKIVTSVCVDPVKGLRINCLNVIVQKLKRLAEIQKEGYTEPVIIYTVSRVTDMIHNGTALYWLANGGKSIDGEAKDEKELELWKEFYSLYGGLIADVAFKDVSKLPSAQNNTNYRTKFAVSDDLKIVGEHMSKLWDLVKKTEEETSSRFEELDEEVI